MQNAKEQVFQQDVIGHLIPKAKQALGLMKERRTALISAAVTGKIDVRSEAEYQAESGEER